MSAQLEEYNRKRDFAKTLEPRGSAEPLAPPEALRFVVQHHMARREHYDLRLEWNGVLLSWAVPKGPSYTPGDKRLAVQVEDHPLAYRHFEGTIPKGEYGGGTVMLWDEGFWEPHGNVDEGLRSGSLKFTLLGRRLQGRWALVRMKAGKEAGETQRNWLLLKEKDAYMQADGGIAHYTTSIRTGRTMEEIAASKPVVMQKNPFSSTGVQLAVLVHALPQGNDWLYELKYDGYRILAYIEGGGVRLMTRGGNDYAGKFWAIVPALSGWAAGRAMVLDGEMVVADKFGRTDFQALQSYMRAPQGKRLTYMVFDLLALEGVDLRPKPLLERKALLETLLHNAPPCLHYSRYVVGKGEESFQAACRLNLEGIVGKKANSAYTGTRNGDWIKRKCAKRQEFVIGGYTQKTRQISALLLGVYRGGQLVYAGRAGSGLGRNEEKTLLPSLQKLTRQTSPFKTPPVPRNGETLVWVEPNLVAEVQFTGWTQDNLLRQASYKGLRTDKKPTDIVRETQGEEHTVVAGESCVEEKQKHLMVGGVRISNPDKVLFDHPVITKGEVARYYAAVAQRMLPYIRHRILSIVRCPKGVTQACFYKKHPGAGSKGIVPISVTDSEGETEEYFYIEDTTGLLSEAQMGTLEFHTWGSRVETLEQPDILVFDLDPDEGMGLDMVRQGVRDLKGILAELSLQAYLKTSGGKGYHIVVPLQPAVSWDAFHDFARRVAQVMEQKWPDRYTSNIRKIKRKNRIFIDWIRNARGATSVAPYSLRAREGARVSMPIAWEELDHVAPDGINLANALQRLQDKDPWWGFFDQHQLLK